MNFKKNFSSFFFWPVLISSSVQARILCDRWWKREMERQAFECTYGNFPLNFELEMGKIKSKSQSQTEL